MLKTYKPLKHKIFGAHKLIEHLVVEVWCKADANNYYDKLNDELKILNDKNEWFRDNLNEIYEVCKTLSLQAKADFETAFLTNNKISELCTNPSMKIDLSTLDENLMTLSIPFFKELYKRFLSWVDVKNRYGSKKEYYDDLKKNSGFDFCPCCGYGQIKTIYDKGHSAFDHYLPLKYYPFSVVNFYNLIPLCSECNSDNKGETDILEDGKKVFYPINESHPEIKIDYDISSTSFKEIVIKIKSTDKLDNKHINVKFNIVSDEMGSWDATFNIKTRYFGQVASNRGSWLGDVREAYRDPDVNTPTFEHAFDRVIKTDANKYQGFLKSPYLNRMKSFSSLIEALEEVTGDYKII